MKHEVIIDTSKCVGCGLCAKDCVAGSIKVVDSKAQVVGSGCISCGHCEAICPVNAISLTGFEDEVEEFEKQTRLDPSQLMNAIKQRRTIRNFTSQIVEEEKLNMIIEAGRLAPTGGNSQSTRYIVLENKISEAEKVAVNMFASLIKAGKFVIPFLKNMEIDDNFFFKKAPLVIVIIGNSVNGSLAAENMAFMAEGLGLGVLYSGFFTTCANTSGKLKKILGLKTGEKVVTTMVIGYSAVNYKRTARREKAKVTRL